MNRRFLDIETRPINRLRSTDRLGATIIEVMFAIGILLFGLLGIAAFIPAASKLARNSIDLNRGASIGQSVAQEFNARGFGNSNRWIQIDDTGNAAVQFAVANPTELVAIDNLFVSRPENLVQAGTQVGIGFGQYNRFDGSNNNNYFRRNQFPFYHNTYNPLIDPRNHVNQNPWPAMPRLRRVAVSTDGSLTAPSVQESSKLLDDTDQLAFEAPQDKTLPVSQIMRVGAQAPTNNDFPVPGMRSGRPEYSWFATIQPQSASIGTLSVVVVRGRDRTFETPVDGTPAVNDPTDPLELSERLAYVVPDAPDFRGGAGGTVTLVWSTAVSSDLSTDGWIMLIRNRPAPLGPIHAWYRIVNADRDSIETTFEDPQYSVERPVWQRNVTLEGPDWTFASTSSPVGDTIAVLVEGVVSVTESTVRLQ